MGKNLKGEEIGKGLNQRKDGIYCARKSFPDGSTICLYGSNFQKLRKEFNDAVNEYVSRKNRRQNYTVRQWFDEWFDTYKKPTIKPSSVNPMRRKVENTFLPLIGEKNINSILSIDLQQALNALLDDGKYAKKSIAEALNRLEECFSSATNNKIIDVNPAHGLKLPYDSDRENYSERRYLTEREIQIFLESTKDAWFYELFYIIICTGLRISEASGLKWSDLDFENNCITVNQALCCEYDNGVKKLYFTTLKTNNSYRIIPMTNKVKLAFQSQYKKIESLKSKLANRYKCVDEFNDLVFATSKGTPLTRYSAEHALVNATREINLRESFLAAQEGREPVLFDKIYPHALRHTFCSLCFISGINVKTTQQLMGHAHLSTTMDIYTHLSSEHVKQDISKLEYLIDDICT